MFLCARSYLFIYLFRKFCRLVVTFRKKRSNKCLLKVFWKLAKICQVGKLVWKLIGFVFFVVVAKLSRLLLEILFYSIFHHTSFKKKVHRENIVSWAWTQNLVKQQQVEREEKIGSFIAWWLLDQWWKAWPNCSLQITNTWTNNLI